MAKAKLPATERIMSHIPGNWVIPSEKGDWHLLQGTLPAMNQKKAAKYVSPQGYRAVSMPEYFDLFAGIYALRNSEEAEKARIFLKGTFREFYPFTLTRIHYTPKGKDLIIHNYGRENEERIKIDFVGENGLIGKVLSLEQSLALTGKKPGEVKEIMNYINKTPMYVWRLHVKSQNTMAAVAGFVADSVGAGLDCDWDPSDSGDGLGVYLGDGLGVYFRPKNDNMDIPL